MLPVSRRELIKKLKKIGFKGPYSGGNHQFMSHDTITIRIPNPHKTKISVDLLKRILNQANISREEWLKL